MKEENFLSWLNNNYNDDLTIYSTGKYGKILLGRYKGNTIRFMIDEKDKLMLSISKQSEDLLGDFMDKVSNYLGYSPLCSYDITLDEIDEKVVFSTIEWRREKTEERLIDIVNLEKPINGVSTSNIKVFSEKNSDEYKKSFVKNIKSRRKLKRDDLNFWYSL